MSDNTEYYKSPDIRGTVIPNSAAHEDGRSLGFDPNKPAKVIIDPDEDGFEVDFTNLAESKDKFNAASKKIINRKFTSEFYKKFQPSTEPIAASEPIKESAMEELLLKEKKKAETYLDQPRVIPNSPKDTESKLRLFDEMYASFLATQNKQELPVPGISINIPFLESPTPQKPKYDVYFDLGEMGALVAKYHAVVLGSDCLCLIYDTRFEDGFQYLPPVINRDVKIKLNIPKLSKDKADAKSSFLCSSHGLHWTLGCLDVVVLLTHEGELR